MTFIQHLHLINMEQLLHYVWKHKLFALKPQQTTDGKAVDGVLWVGNVEIHQQASDWFKHNHHQDPAYDSVILHVASQIDAAPARTNGEPIPQMELRYPSYLASNYERLLREDRYPACHELIPQLSPFFLHSWLSSLQIERFEAKAGQILQRLEACNRDWENAFFITLARNFGFGVNADTFELWAKSVPLGAVNKHRDNLFQIEAIFFGQAGLLEELPVDAYTESMMKEYKYLRHKFELTPSSECHWRFLRMRPGNFPHIRIPTNGNGNLETSARPLAGRHFRILADPLYVWRNFSFASEDIKQQFHRPADYQYRDTFLICIRKA